MTSIHSSLAGARRAGARVALAALISLGFVAAGCGSGGQEPAAGGGQIPIYFSKMFSAFDGVHTFKVPVKAGVTGVQWTVSDPALVELDPIEDDGSNDGSEAMLIMKGPGTVTVTAKAGGLAGSAVLTITGGTAAAYEVGKARYNDGMPLRTPGMPGMGPPMINREAACTNCHGPGAQDVEHSPTQIGGYSDEEVKAIFTMGKKPAGAKQRIIADAQAWSRVHQWQMTEEEKAGILLYLRSIEPASQGPADFNGMGVFRGRPDGGMGGFRGDGGFGRGDGGGRREAGMGPPPPGPDAGAPVEMDASVD